MFFLNYPFQLAADTDNAVKNANALLDRVMKDIVTEDDDFDVAKFIPLISERISTNNAYIRQFLIGWIMVLDSVPDISILYYLPQFLHGLFTMLNDANKEIIQQASTALDGRFGKQKNNVFFFAYNFFFTRRIFARN